MKKKNKRDWISHWLKKAYGLTKEEKKKLWEYQKGRCAICGIKLRLDSDCNIDHDHGKNDFRANGVKGVSYKDRRDAVNGIVCWQCNTLMGKLARLDPDPLIAAQKISQYLLHPPAQEVLTMG
jgi:hypothetical protein